MNLKVENIRNIAIIAHVDHGKTTLVDKLLHYSGNVLDEKAERVLDSDQLEKERGITIFAKNTSINWKGYHINIVDTPGHADFGGEVERILSMVDSVLLLVDASEGPMPQTRFVTQKAFEKKLHPILVINKIDKDDVRPDWVLDQVFDLFCELDATDEQLDFPVIYTSSTKDIATYDLKKQESNMSLVLDMIIERVSEPKVDPNGTFQMQISALGYSTYVGTIGIGKVYRGSISSNTAVKVVRNDQVNKSGKVLQIFSQQGLNREEIPQALAGDIVSISGIDDLRVSDTICDPNHIEGLPILSIDEPTVSMMFMVNDSPFAGKEGKFVTSRKIKDRLDKELIHNVAMKVENTESPDKFKVSGRGELHIAILIENMRREGFELSISRPEVIKKIINDIVHEPFENLVVNVPTNYQGVVMELLNNRQAKLQNITVESKDRVRLEYLAPTKGLIGFHIEFINLTSGTGIMHHVFDHYGPVSNEQIISRKQGALIANSNGVATGFAIWNLQPRGELMISPQTEVYEGMVVGLHNRSNDLVVNVVKEKQLTNVRASGKDEKIVLIPPLLLTLERSLEIINEDELVEVTPSKVRIRKKFLKEHERKRANKN